MLYEDRRLDLLTVFSLLNLFVMSLNLVNWRTILRDQQLRIRPDEMCMQSTQSGVYDQSHTATDIDSDGRVLFVIRAIDTNSAQLPWRGSTSAIYTHTVPRKKTCNSTIGLRKCTDFHNSFHWKILKVKETIIYVSVIVMSAFYVDCVATLTCEIQKSETTAKFLLMSSQLIYI